jgi:hypothetical protein
MPWKTGELLWPVPSTYCRMVTPAMGQLALREMSSAAVDREIRKALPGCLEPFGVCPVVQDPCLLAIT